MATKKKPGLPDEMPDLPGMPDEVRAGRGTYRIDPDTVRQAVVDAVLVGRADLEHFKAEQFSDLMRVLTTLRLRAFALPFATYDGGQCSVVRRHLKTVRPSEMARAIIGAGRDPWHKQRKSPLAAILARTAELQHLADDTAPPPPRQRDVVIAEYLRLWPVAADVDLAASWPELERCERSSTPVLELYIRQMRDAVAASRMSDDEKAKVLS